MFFGSNYILKKFSISSTFLPLFLTQNPEFSHHYEETVDTIRHLEQTVVERKDNVLDILLKTEDDVLDDKSVIVSLKDAKAKVFEILNDLNMEKKAMAEIDIEIPRYKFISQRLRGLINLIGK